MRSHVENVEDSKAICGRVMGCLASDEMRAHRVLALPDGEVGFLFAHGSMDRARPDGLPRGDEREAVMDKPTMLQVKYVPEYSIVRLSDGQIGAVGHGTIGHKHIIVYPDWKTGRPVPGTEQVEVIKYAAQVAAEELQRMAQQAETQTDDRKHLVETLELVCDVIDSAWPVFHDPPATTEESAAQVALSRIAYSLSQLQVKEKPVDQLCPNCKLPVLRDTQGYEVCLHCNGLFHVHGCLKGNYREGVGFICQKCLDENSQYYVVVDGEYDITSDGPYDYHHIDDALAKRSFTLGELDDMMKVTIFPDGRMIFDLMDRVS